MWEFVWLASFINNRSFLLVHYPFPFEPAAVKQPLEMQLIYLLKDIFVVYEVIKWCALVGKIYN